MSASRNAGSGPATRKLYEAAMAASSGHVRFGSKADMCSALGDVRFVPIADMQPSVDGS